MLKNHQKKIWESIFDQCYLRASEALDKFQNFTGWQSSYTGEPIPKKEMKSWVNETVSRIQRLKPKKIYEIGAGAGLIMFPLLDDCEYYYATDLSSESINYLKQHTPSKYQHTEFSQKSADDASSFAENYYDAFILNSVVQYFPSLSYLEGVIKNIVEKVASGGVIFIGDVRNLKYLEAFHASVEIYKASETDDQVSLREKIHNRIANDVELSVDPSFFMGLKEEFPRISSIEIKLKKGIVQNELTKFRYDVLLHIEKEAPKHVHEIHWTSDREALQAEISKVKAPFIIKHVPNYSVEGVFKAMELLQSDKEVSVNELKALIDFDTASQRWKDLYALFPEDSQVEPIMKIDDPGCCQIFTDKGVEG
ncbi:MAG: methyltransferase domain-containing protein [Simkaniaceae bacterium]|nr:MAG: methyltransferase domain-containing protein [Simkaniaceae bacterium]